MKLCNLIICVAFLCFAEVFNSSSGFGSLYARSASRLRSRAGKSGRCAKLTTLKAPKGVIKFPLTGKYGNNLDCSWQITAPAGKVVRIKVDSIDIESSEGCEKCCWFDWLSLYDGQTAKATSLMVKLCGAVARPSPFVTKSNAALVTFRSNSKRRSKGFQLSYQVIKQTKTRSDAEECSGEVVEWKGSKSNGVLRSPGFDEKRFPDRAKCRWRIVAPAKKVIQVAFETMDMDSDDTCDDDALSFYDGRDMSAPLLGTYCGRRLPPDFVTSGNALLVSFESENRWSEGRFSISWTIINDPGLRGEGAEGCNGKTAVLRQLDGVLTSPNYGSGRKYPNQARCSWRIVVDKSLKVLLTFEKFSLEPQLEGEDCHDTLSVYDGPSSASPIFGSFCGLRVPSDMMSNGNQIYLEFTSDKSRTAPGFLIKYSAKDTSGSELGCGVPDVIPRTYSRIVGGSESIPHSWPWMIQIEILYKKQWKFWCGGAILYPRWIITAAHCAKDLGPTTHFKLIIGDHNRLKDEGIEQIWNVEKIFVHDGYDDVTNNNDIALLYLPRELQYDHYIKPICLPEADAKDNSVCIIAGWGQTKGTGKEGVLYQIYIPVIDHKKCNSKDWYSGRITNNMLCAGYPEGRIDSCQGDSGGPLVCMSPEGRWVVSGITSFGDGCAVAQHPGVYTRVTKYLEWISEITGVSSEK